VAATSALHCTTIYLLCPMHASNRRPTVYITKAFQPSQKYHGEQIILHGFSHHSDISLCITFHKKQVFMFLHLKCNVYSAEKYTKCSVYYMCACYTFLWNRRYRDMESFSIGNWISRFSEGWTVMTETSVLGTYS
jgi:hypothetical protein